ncbi:transmembrane protein [Bacillus sp. JCM 19046]|uniref:Membrane protein YpjA n=1 Tax=Shouchella xiaoxiensis TaxID=766895 RepID=A0ABS2SYS2_9BACI|nr:DUF1405 domain-containing protein [Shouchella xiaoxiensis]MBM7840176.1 putative membrane protein YpjA [Shouchella xiaoxiensis]GAF14374.1 transmembrane protein [Bacillus sp. JCM 19045]GAF19848.1 transmembrane protein [Bacillus sp. JCM 19046]
MLAYLYGLLTRRSSLIILLIINAIGTLYGYYWYGEQLGETPWYFLLFVPDSPTASLFFVLVLIGFLLRKQSGLIEALAAVTLLKYGVWAVVMNTFQVLEGAPLHWTIIMLNLSHAGMALQALLFMPFFRIKSWHLVVALLWTVHNDIIDYVFGMHPWLSYRILPYINEIGYFTFWLGLISVGLVYLLNVRKRAPQLNLPH